MAFSCCLKHPVKLLHVSPGNARNKHKFLKGSETANSGFHHILSLWMASGNTNSTFYCICFELLGTGGRKVEGQGRRFKQGKNKCGKNEWIGFEREGESEAEDGWDQCRVLSTALTNGCCQVLKYLRPAMLLKFPLHQKVTWENKQGIWL